MVQVARLELALPKKPDFESSVSTNSTTPALFFIQLYTTFLKSAKELQALVFPVY